MGTLSDKDIPQAQRAARPGWRDPRLWIGVALVAASVLVGAQVVSAADDSTAVWSVRDEVTTGTLLVDDDFVEARVRFDSAAEAALYLEVADGIPVRRHLDRTLGAGELLPRSALVNAPDGNVQVSVAVAAAQVPPTVRPGGTVDLWLAPQSSSGEKEARPLVREVLVVQSPEVASDLTGATGDRQVVLAVPDDTAVLADVIAASGSGQLMLIGRR